jgi:glucosamine-6-phosphate deaminase
MNCYAVLKEDFKKLRPKVNFSIVKELENLHYQFTRDLANLVKSNNEIGKKTVVVIPVGPLEFTPFAELCNKEKISCENLITINMDEYLKDDHSYIDYENPLCFRHYMDDNLFNIIEKDLRPPKENRVFPEPNNPEQIRLIIEDHGLDVTYGGVGISGHLAFNDPPENEKELTEENVKNSVTRIVNISRETRTGIAIGGTGGNWDIIPKKAVTIGMKEILSAKKIQLYGMRTWHAGTLRRALFGDISPTWPASYVQQHSNVSVTLTEYAAELPLNNVTLAIGK